MVTSPTVSAVRPDADAGAAESVAPGAFGDGLQALGEAFTKLAEEGNAIAYNEVHQVIGQGNFVHTMSEGLFGDAPTAYYDLFRLEDGKTVEHWDVIQEIPAEMAHDNGKF